MEVHYKRISLWARVMGVSMMVSAGLSLLISPLAFLSPSIGMGIVFFLFMGAIAAGTIWVGKKLYDAGVKAKEYLETPTEEKQDEIIEEYGAFLFANVVYTLGGMALSVPFILIVLAIASQLPVNY